MSTLEEFPEVKQAYTRYIEQFNSEPTNPTQLIKFCQKHQIPGVTWSKCSKYFKLLTGQSTANNNGNQHKKTTSQPLTKKSIKTTSPTTENNGVSSPTTNINDASNGSTSTSTSTSSPKVVDVVPPRIKPMMSSPKLSSNNHRKTQSAIDAKSYKKQNTDKKNDSSSALTPTPVINDLFIDLKEDPAETKKDDDDDDDSKSQTNGSTKRSSFTNTAATFKSIFVDQKLKPLPSTHQSAPTATIHKTVKKEVKKHPLLEKPWNRHKSSVWPKNRYL